MFFSVSPPYTPGIPWTQDTAKRYNSMGLPIWFTRGSFHRAIVSKVGPYIDPEGLFTILDDEVLLEWEVKQPPAGSEQAPRTVVFSILRVNRLFVTPGSLTHKNIDPLAEMVPTAYAAVWFGYASPPEVVGLWRGHGTELRDNSGSLLK